MKKLVLLWIVTLLVGTGLGLSYPREMPRSSTIPSAHPEAVAEIIRATNQIRQRTGAGPLLDVPYLSDAATAHSQEMLELNYFSHTSPTPGIAKPKDRVQAFGGWDTKVGENIYRASGISPRDLAQRVIAAWEKSPSHYQNLINPEFNSVGVGIAVKGEDFVVTQVFSYQSITIKGMTATPARDGYDLTVEGQIREGTREGGVFVNNSFEEKFSANPEGNFHIAIHVPSRATISLSQKKAENTYSQSLSFPVESIREQ